MYLLFIIIAVACIVIYLNNQEKAKMVAEEEEKKRLEEKDRQKRVMAEKQRLANEMQEKWRGTELYQDLLFKAKELAEEHKLAAQGKYISDSDEDLLFFVVSVHAVKIYSYYGKKSYWCRGNDYIWMWRYDESGLKLTHECVFNEMGYETLDEEKRDALVNALKADMSHWIKGTDITVLDKEDRIALDFRNYYLKQKAVF